MAAAATGITPPIEAEEQTKLSKQYETRLGLAHTTMQVLKDRIKLHYDLASDYYLSLWGEHIHHGYWPTEESKAKETKEVAQVNLIRLLLDISKVAEGSRMLDVGCGIGGTSRHLASELGCEVTGITISGKQVEMAGRLTKSAAAASGEGTMRQEDEAAATTTTSSAFAKLGKGKVRFLELDAEKMGDHFAAAATATAPNTDTAEKKDKDGFDVVWISEALSHFPDKELFFRNAHRVLKKGGRLVIADWFKAKDLGDKAFEEDIKPIEDGMLLPPLCTQAQYVEMATTSAGFKILAPPKDISKDVSKTWDITWSLIQNPSLWAFALSQGRDGIAFLQSFRAMRRGYANGHFRYAVMSFEK